MIELHKLLMPPHPGGFYISSALCSCGEWQYDAKNQTYLYMDYKTIMAQYTQHVLEWLEKYELDTGTKSQTPSST